MKLKKKYFMIDLDGTIYHRSLALPYAKEFIELLKNKEYPFVFFTNSPEFSHAQLAEKLKSIGIDCRENDFLSTADVSLDYIKSERKKSINSTKIYILGSKSMKELFVEEGFQLIENTEEKADYVVIGYDKNIDLLMCENACTHIFNNAIPILCNRDHSIPSEKGFVPHTGAISALIEFTTKKMPIDMGKPTKYALDAVLKKMSCSKEELCIVGDNLETDIALGENFNISSSLVLTGLTSKEMLNFDREKEFLEIYDDLEALSKSL